MARRSPSAWSDLARRRRRRRRRLRRHQLCGEGRGPPNRARVTPRRRLRHVHVPVDWHSSAITWKARRRRHASACAQRARLGRARYGARCMRAVSDGDQLWHYSPGIVYLIYLHWLFIHRKPTVKRQKCSPYIVCCQRYSVLNSSSSYSQRCWTLFSLSPLPPHHHDCRRSHASIRFHASAPSPAARKSSL